MMLLGFIGLGVAFRQKSSWEKYFLAERSTPAGGKDRHRGAHLHRAIYQATGCADRQQLDFVPKA